MNTYIKMDGSKFVGPFMKAPELPKGHYWGNVSKLGASPMVFVEKVYQ